MLKLTSIALTLPILAVACSPEKRNYRTKLPSHSFGDNAEISVQLTDSDSAVSYKLKATCVQFKSRTERLEVGVFVAGESFDSAITSVREVNYQIQKNRRDEVTGYATSTRDLQAPLNVTLELGDNGSFSVLATSKTSSIDDSIFAAPTGDAPLELLGRTPEGESTIRAKSDLGAGSVQCRLL